MNNHTHTKSYTPSPSLKREPIKITLRERISLAHWTLKAGGGLKMAWRDFTNPGSL